MLVNKSLLDGGVYPLNNGLEIKNPAVRDVISFGEDNYNALIRIFLIYPVDLIAELYHMGFEDYEVFSQYDIFMLLYRGNPEFYKELMKFFFGELELLPVPGDKPSGDILYDPARNAVFDLTSYMLLSSYIRTIHHLEEDRSKLARKSKSLKRALLETSLANADYVAKRHEIEKLSGNLNRYFETAITKLVIASRFSRDELTGMKLYRFNETYQNTVTFYYWKFKMQGVYSGNVDVDKINRKELEWFTT